MQFTIWTEKRPDKGEDALPTLLINPLAKRGALAVYDGLGGAGSKVYEYIDDTGRNFKHSGAFLASRLAKQITELFFQPIVAEGNSIKELADELKVLLDTTFTEHIEQLDKNPSKLRSKLIKRLPTTLAGIFYETNHQQALELTSFWAGDSRCYVLTATGLKQLSIDDLNGQPDALENLLMDATISNCVHADGNYQLNISRVILDEPLMLIVATDGCFGYVKSPAHFEYLLLKTLINSQYDVEDWKERLEESLASIAGDDLSMSVLAMGMTTLEDWKIYFYERYKFIQKQFILPVEEADASLDLIQKQQGFLPAEIEKLQEQKRALQEKLWEQYKKDYYLQTQES